MFVLPSLYGGGAERTVVNVLRHLPTDRVDARVGLLYPGGDYLDQVAPERIVLPRIGRGWIDYGNCRRWHQWAASIPLVPLQQVDVLRQFRPHVVMTLMKSMSLAGMFSLPVYGRSRVKWIAREGNNTLAMVDKELGSTAARWLMKHLVRFCYGRTDRVLTISQGVADHLAADVGVPQSQLARIYNAVDVAHVRRQSQAPPPVGAPSRYVLAVGRLDRQKGFDLLLSGLAPHLRTYNLHLVILGQGKEEGALRKLAAQLNIADRLLLPGFAENPWAWMARCQVFVLSSRWEGFGNVLIEAMASGAPVVTTDCPFGPSEIVRHEESGLLTPTEEPQQLGRAVASLLENPQRAARLAEMGRRRAGDFDAGHIAAQYERLLVEMVRPQEGVLPLPDQSELERSTARSKRYTA